MVKRALDIVISGTAIVVFLPVILTLAIMIRFAIGAPVFFTQDRPGLNGIPFRMVKFRTMTNAQDQSGKLLPDADRLTSFGRFLRSSSLDELPELWNILKGDMSIVGPRPLLMEYLPLYSDAQMRRHEVRPGLTGWAQVNGRNAISWNEKFALDLWYVDNRSTWVDCKIIGMTIMRVLKKDGISARGEETMPRFTGLS